MSAEFLEGAQEDKTTVIVSAFDADGNMIDNASLILDLSQKTGGRTRENVYDDVIYIENA